ncbi:MAG: hypothetical protein M3R00_08105, partial [Pseudomonadota bacterium]|nr:hypothetical protein [Pseudomonadota bacterium]
LLGASNFHRTELSRYFTIPADSITRTIVKVIKNSEGKGYFVYIQDRYHALQPKDLVEAAYEATAADVAMSMTILHIVPGKSFKIAARSNLDIYDATARKHYQHAKLFEANGILAKILNKQRLLRMDHVVIDNYCKAHLVSDEWSHTRVKLSHASADEIFLACWNDQSTQKHLFTPEYYKAPLVNGQKQLSKNKAHSKAMHNRVLQGFCECDNPIDRLSTLQNHYSYDNQSVNAPMLELKKYIEWVQHGKWHIVAKKLNDAASRELMMAAMHSLRNEKAMLDALSHSNIRNSLDDNTLLYCAMRFESVAGIVLKQSMWQRLGLRISRLFTSGRFLAEPAKRLYKEQIIKIAQRFPRLLKSRLKSQDDTYYAFTGHRNLLQGWNWKDLMSFWFSKESPDSKKTALDAIFSDRKLWLVLEGTILNQQQADDKLRILAAHGVSYLDFRSPKYSQVLRNAFSHLASDQAVEDFFAAQFRRMCEKSRDEKYDPVTALRVAVASLWMGTMKLPRRIGAQDCAKRAMIRVIRDFPQIFLQIPHELQLGARVDLYEQLLADDVILATFLKNEDFVAALRDDTRKNWTLASNVLTKIQHSIALHRQGYTHHTHFELVHVLRVYGLFFARDGEYLKNAAICQGLLDVMINDYIEMQNVVPIISADHEERILSLLKHATGAQLMSLLLRKNEYLQNLQSDDHKRFYEIAETTIKTNAVLRERLFELREVDEVVEVKKAGSNLHVKKVKRVTLPWPQLLTLYYAEPALIQYLIKEDLLSKEYKQAFFNIGLSNFSSEEVTQLKALPTIAIAFENIDK